MRIQYIIFLIFVSFIYARTQNITPTDSSFLNKNFRIIDKENYNKQIFNYAPRIGEPGGVLIGTILNDIYWKNVLFRISIEFTGPENYPREFIAEFCVFKNKVEFKYLELEYFELYKSKFHNLKFDEIIFHKANMSEIYANKIDFKNVLFTDVDLKFDAFTDWPIISFDNCKIENHFSIQNFGEKKLAISFKTPVEREFLTKIDIDYLNFKLLFSTESFEERVQIYELLLNNFEESGKKLSYQFLDIEFQDYLNSYSNSYIKNFIEKIWWNYGYNKEWIFYWIILLVAFFAFINTFILRRLNRQVYPIGFIEKRLFEWNKQQKNLKVVFNISFFQIWNSIIYTSFIFFGLKFEISNIKEDANRNWINRALLIYLLVIYVFGILCLAYFVNFVIIK